MGTSIPRTIQARAVRSKASHKLPSEIERIEEVIFIPSPVIPSTPTINEAHNMIEAIIAKNAAAGPVQTIRVEQAPLKITTDDKPYQL